MHGATCEALTPQSAQRAASRSSPHPQAGLFLVQQLVVPVLDLRQASLCAVQRRHHAALELYQQLFQLGFARLLRDGLRVLRGE